MFIYVKDNYRDFLINTKRIVELYEENGKFYVIYELGSDVETAELNVKMNSLRDLQKILNS